MPYIDDDSEDDDYRSASLIVMQRQHYEAGMEILKTAALGNAAFAVAEERREECRNGEMRPGAAFWNDVWNYLMHKPAPTLTQRSSSRKRAKSGMTRKRS